MVESLTEAQRLRVPLISVWGSADQITESGDHRSYAFRVSLKDSWGVTAMLKRITTQLKVQTACAMLPNTAWGRSSDAVIKSQASDLGLSVPVTHWYNWGDRSFEAAYSKCLVNEGRAILFVGNEQEAAILIKEIARRPAPERLPVVAHWGTAGGILHELVREDLKAVRFEVIQTFTFVGNQRPLALRLARAALKENGLSNVADIPSPVGVAQAYDAARLVAMAIDLAQSTRGEDVRAALEKLPTYDGVIKKYAPAFTPTRHDALDASSVIFVNITPDGALVPIE
ncbi:ABC transporter substrate-binding protein [Zwartia sp.]|uniref:ABC transporter substrate-binding protein n=1 Tax=Zwartia sp. TaxID=2978004 RepID=UPI003BAF9E6F